MFREAELETLPGKQGPDRGIPDNWEDVQNQKRPNQMAKISTYWCRDCTDIAAETTTLCMAVAVVDQVRHGLGGGVT